MTRASKLTDAEEGFFFALRRRDEKVSGRDGIVDAIAAPLLVDVLAGGDPRQGPEYFDLRAWVEPTSSPPLISRLIILGGVLIGSLESASMRRKLAASLRRLPPEIGLEIRRILALTVELDAGVGQRIYEVFSRIARQGNPADQELAALGLFFLVSAAVFRQNRELPRLEENLPPGLARRVESYCRACIRSKKPELSPMIAETVEQIGRACIKSKE